MKDMQVIDLRSPFEKRRDALYDEVAEMFKRIYPTALGATPERVISYIAEQVSLSRETVRKVLIAKRVYIPRHTEENPSSKPLIQL